MRIDIKAIRFPLLETQRDLFYQKLKSLEKFTKRYDKYIRLLVRIEKETSHHQSGEIFLAKAELDIKGKNPIIEVRGTVLESLIDELRDGLERLIINNKEIHQSKFKRGARFFKNLLHKFWKNED